MDSYAVCPGNPVRTDEPLNRGLTSWWMQLPNRLGGGGTRFRDLCGRNHGTLTNTPTWVGPIGRAGGYGSHSYVSASSQYIATGITSSLTTFSMCAWFNSNAYGATNRDIFGKDVASPRGWTLHTVNNIIRLESNGTGSHDGTTTLVTNTWYHVWFVSNGTTLWGYLNGKLEVGPITVTLSNNNGAQLDIGRRPFTSFNHYWSGYIDDVRLYNSRAVSATEALAIYQDSRLGSPRTLNRVRHRPYSETDAAGAAPTTDYHYLTLLGVGA
jgi:hypothetical protein